MSDVEHDPVVRRAIEELRQVPKADAAAIRAVVSAAAAARVTPADDDATLVAAPVGARRPWMIIAVAAAAAFMGFALSSARRQKTETPVVAMSAQADTSRNAINGLQPVAHSTAEALPVPRQFVFNGRGARSVSLVGDFNGWNPSKAPMTRSTEGDLWSVTIPVIPGRHTYGFMVDDSVFTLDPRAPRARDRDLGAVGSVIIVGKP